VVLELVDDELDEYFVVYMFNFAHMTVAVTAGFPCDVCMNLMHIPFVSNLGCIGMVPDSLRKRNIKSFCETIWLVC
jgi:hypothetical protein